MKKALYTVFGIAAITALTLLGGSKHVGPANLYPDPSLTPGKVETLDFKELTRGWDGQTYSQFHRSVSSKEKTLVCKEYPLNCKGTYEVDHFVPICLGGSNAISNLWAMPETLIRNGQNFGFRQKDLLEAELCRDMKSGKITPIQAQNEITSDWVKFYSQQFSDKFGAVNNSFDDGEDEIIR